MSSLNTAEKEEEEKVYHENIKLYLMFTSAMVIVGSIKQF